MKKRSLTYFGLLLLGLLFGVQLNAQTNVNQPYNTGVQVTSTLPGGSGFFNYYDNNGPALPYSPNSNHDQSVQTFAPSGPGLTVAVQFTAFNTENSFDALYAYDGSAITSPQIASTNGPLIGFPLAGGWTNGTGAPTQNPGGTPGLCIASGAGGELTFAFRSDGSVQPIGWEACVTEIPSATACNFQAPADQLNLSTDVDNCTATLVVNTPTAAAACLTAPGVVITYSVNGDVPVVINQPFPASITIPGLPAGSHTISWALSADTPCGQIPLASDEQSVNVADLVPPTVNCPDDIFINLGAGECSSFVNYSVTATDNCPFLEGPFSLATLNSGGNGGAVGGQVFFDVNNQTGGDITVTELGMNISAATQVEVRLIPGGFAGNTGSPAGWNLVATMDASVGPFSGPFPGNGTITPAIGEFNIPAGIWGVALATPTASNNYSNGNGANQTYTDGNITLNLGGAQNAPWAGLFQPRVWNGSVTYQIGGEAEIIQTQGLPSGSEFDLGTTTNCFEVTDAQGLVGTCCFDVTVLEFTNVTQTLACNDNVQVSLDENCSATIGADMILEGGPYGCYDTRYSVMVLGPLNQQLGNVVNANFIGNGPWTVKVTDVETGQSCWGSIIVEDKIPPVLECRDLTVACTEEIPNIPAPELVGPQIQLQQPFDIIENGPATSPRVYDFDYGYIPAGTPVLDVDVRVKLTGHTWLPDLNMVVIAPDGTTVDFFTLTGCFGQEWPIDVWFDDEGAGNLTMCVDLDVAGAPTQPVCAPGASCMVLDGLDGVDASGTWQVRFEDTAAGDDGVIEEVGLAVTVNLPAIEPTDACGPVDVDFVEAFVDGNCGGPAGTVVRTWTATDESGNESSCQQTITIERPTLDDVEVPRDVTWDCTQYAAWPNIVEPTYLHPFFQDCDDATNVLELTCYDHTCNDNSLNGGVPCDNEDIDNTTQDPCTSTNSCGFNGLENEDIFALTGAGVPSVNGRPLVALCEIGTEHEDITIEVCPGTFKIVRKWTLIDWCSDPVDVREINQVVKVVDETAPTIAAPADLTINVYDATEPPNAGPHAVCNGSVIVPPAAGISDDCSGVNGFTTEIWTFNAQGPVAVLGSIPTNGGVFVNIPLYQNGIPAQYVVRYYAVDACGNQSFDDTQVTLRDKVPPVAVCDEITEVSITNNGIGTGESCSTLHAENLDDGSYDNCAPVYFLMAKMDDSFSQDIFTRCYYPSRDFCCEDIGEQQVILLVLDGDPTPFFSQLNSPALGCDGTPGLFLTSGFSALNYNVCMVTVQVTDKLSPILISCPADQRITCDFYADNLETQLANAADDEEACNIMTPFFGQATFFDNCSLNESCSFNNGLDQCLEGVLTRTWSAVDDAGNNGLQTCTQRIFVDHVSDWVVEFPADITVECGTSVPDFGEPEIFFETCELVGVSFEDEVFTTVADACYKILRTWTVINWCVVGQEIDQEFEEDPENQIGLPFPQCDLDGDGDCDNRTFRDSWANGTYPGAAQATQTLGPDTDFDSDPWDGYITYQQTIKVNDTVDPVFTNGCEIPDVCILDNTCGATVLLPTPEIDECSDDVSLTAQINIGGVWLNGFGPYLNVAPGTYDVRYVAMDNCNNQTDCQTTVTVADCKKPTPYCKNGIIVELMVVDPAMVEVWASDLNDNSFDNCPGALKFSFSDNVNDDVITFTCDDLGQQPVELWVTDAAGNQDFCETFVIIQANMNQCDDDPLVAGATSTEAGEGVEGVDININSPAGMNYDVATDVTGTFSSPVAGGNDYSITPVYDEEPLNGVSTFDLVLISKHILGVQPLDSPYKLIAADANKSNSITTFDMLTIRKLILFIDTEFPNNTSWRFFDANCSFSNPANPFADMCAEVININDITAAELANDFVAVKIGDVNGSAATNLLGSADDRTMVDDLVFDVEDVIVQEGELTTVEFKATDFHASGYQFTLNFDNSALDFVEVGAGLADASNFGLSMVNEGVITASWNSSEAKKLAANEVVFSLTFKANHSGLLSDLISLNSRYTVAEAYNADAQLLNVALSFNSDVVANGFELYQNTPNPFASTTNIGFYLPEATSATLTISDVQGKVVYVQEGDFAKGYNNVNLQRNQLNATGVLYYRLDTDTESATRKMILVD